MHTTKLVKKTHKNEEMRLPLQKWCHLFEPYICVAQEKLCISKIRASQVTIYQKNVHLKNFWTQFKNLHCQGPCSLRPCISRPYCTLFFFQGSKGTHVFKNKVLAQLKWVNEKKTLFLDLNSNLKKSNPSLFVLAHILAKALNLVFFHVSKVFEKKIVFPSFSISNDFN
jgi:hypothetical protein